MRATTARIETFTGWEAVTGHETAPRNVKNAALLVAAPFIGLAFVVGLPIFGLAVLAWFAARALRAHWARAARFTRNVVLFAAAPFVGLLYVLAFPLVGLGTLVWMAVRAACERPAAA